MKLWLILLYVILVQFSLVIFIEPLVFSSEKESLDGAALTLYDASIQTWSVHILAATVCYLFNHDVILCDHWVQVSWTYCHSQYQTRSWRLANGSSQWRLGDASSNYEIRRELYNRLTVLYGRKCTWSSINITFSPWQWRYIGFRCFIIEAVSIRIVRPTDQFIFIVWFKKITKYSGGESFGIIINSSHTINHTFVYHILFSIIQTIFPYLLNGSAETLI